MPRDVAEPFAEPAGSIRCALWTEGCAAREPESCFGHEYADADLR